jgi:galactokinase
VHSEGYDEPFKDDVSLLDVRPDEQGSTNALIRGVAAYLRERGSEVGGFCATVTSDVAVGSGLSSSAAFEVLIGTVFNHFYNEGAIEPPEIALAGRHAENQYFGKPSGLMDQMTSAVGGFVTIDFGKPTDPEVRQVRCDLGASGLSLVVTDTGGSHADLTPEYASVQKEMQAVSRALGAEVLRDASCDQMFARVGELRKQLGDRAILRALHFFQDNARVVDQVAALEAGDIDGFLALVNESGRSSWTQLQNCYVAGAAEQGVSLALALSRTVLEGRGAWRVHGGGFAGTILAVVPNDLLDRYVTRMDSTFGEGAACVLRVRETGATRLTIGE